MTKSDLALWLDVPFSTLHSWLKVEASNLAPRGPRAKTIFKRLKQLEWAIEHSIGMPIPEMLRARDRPLHILRTRDAIDRGVSEDDPA